MAAIAERVEVAKGAEAGKEGAVPDSYWSDVATGPLSDSEIAEYTRLATERSMSILGYAAESDAWTYAKEKDGTKIYQMEEEGSPIKLMKGITHGVCDYEQLKKNVKGETTTPLVREMPVMILCRAPFSIGRSAFHSYGLDFHSRVLLYIHDRTTSTTSRRGARRAARP